MKLKELLKEVYNIDELSSHASKSKKTIQKVREVTSKKENVIVDDKEYKVVRSLQHSELKKGMIVLATYNAYNQGAEVYEILGLTDDDEKYGEGGIKFDSVRELLKNKNAKSLKELEDIQSKNKYGYHSYLYVRDLNDKEEGPWFYLYNGFWSRGSGAEKLSFWLLEEV
jgi:FAD synthase